MSGVALARAVRVASAIAADYGIAVSEPVVVHDRANVLVHLAPAPVLARLPGLTGIVRPDVGDYLARDVEVARYLETAGIPVVAPSPLLPAGPHERDTHLVTFWRYARPVPDQRHRPAEFAGMLAELHAALRDYPGSLPTRPPLLVDEVIPHLHRPADLLTELRADAEALYAELLDEGGPVQPLHGDAHAGNLLRTEDGPRWIDFEDTWRGPLTWDLACLAGSSHIDGAAALAAYPDAPTDLGSCERGRQLEGVVWGLFLAERGLTDPDEADQRLAAWRAR